jgi:integrase
MPRPPRVQITRNGRQDGSVTYGLRVRVGGADDRVPLGNSLEGWDESRVDAARRQLLAKIELGLWTPGKRDGSAGQGTEPSFRELATDWLEDRVRNPAIRERTTELNEAQLTRYLLPFFGDLLPSQITPTQIKEYRRRIHEDNAEIRAAEQVGRPILDPRNDRRIRTLGNESINKTLRTLAQILDEAEEAGWIDRNPARGRKTREPLERRRRGGALDLDEFIDLLDAASRLDKTRHSARTLERAAIARALRDEVGLEWKAVANRLNVSQSTAIYLYGCQEPDRDQLIVGRRRAVIATLGLAGPRVSELCELDNQDVDLAKARILIRDAKTEAGIRDVDVHGRLLSELQIFERLIGERPMDAPAFPTRTDTRRTKDNIRLRVIEPVVKRANQIRAARKRPPIHLHVTPHTFRRTYITYMLAAGHDIPYVQSQVGHLDPTLTLSVYAQLMRRADRDQLRSEVRAFLATPVAATSTEPATVSRSTPQIEPARHLHTADANGLKRLEKAGKGRAASL